MAIISESGVAFLDSAPLEKLGELYDHYGRSTEVTLVRELKKLDLDETGAEGTGDDSA